MADVTPLAWETIQHTNMGTLSRANVEGGWLVLYEHNHTQDGKAEWRPSMTFLPDADHSWDPNPVV